MRRAAIHEHHFGTIANQLKIVDRKKIDKFSLSSCASAVETFSTEMFKSLWKSPSEIA